MSTTVVVKLLSEPESNLTPREHKAEIKKETKTYWLVLVDGYHSPWKFSKSDNLRIKPEYDQREFRLHISTVQNLGTIDTLIKEATKNHTQSQQEHEYYLGKMMGLAAGVFACFGREHEQYERIMDCRQSLEDEWQQLKETK
ncbi:hypothetical protein CJF42_25005 [Pseudoalteromonas sp. NBT06-2]|uniref:hypothetical protein n=1 Tax=Pseudoalteromonas sp. NBT06-2 TaxID=2025950 RepID=UPI000BA53750|nr:hypothetical protein [Pseudoalteromonas sp. NBT06-2]PAJ71756.1 hypothetical protein CJF42_25005 [Pseudoalteromonas sp. NBT06-2]